jgi:hypothetical protein
MNVMITRCIQAGAKTSANFSEWHPTFQKDLVVAIIKALAIPTEAMLDAATKAADRDEAHMSTYHCMSEGYKAAMDEAIK